MNPYTLKHLESFSPASRQFDCRDQLRWHIYNRSLDAFRAGDAARDRVVSRDDLKERQKFVRSEFLASLGGLPDCDAPLNARTIGTVEPEESRPFRIEKVIFEARPRHYVTANLYIPNDLKKPGGAVQFLCGHHDQAKLAPRYQAVCQMLARSGLIVLIQDPVGQGERSSYYDHRAPRLPIRMGTEEHDYAGTQCTPLGQAIGRYFLHDAMRGIDYLVSRPEVDPARIGVTGSSGGGTQTAMMMLADPRIAAAAPSTFIMNRESFMWCGDAQDAEQIWPGLTAAGIDHEDILLSMCPRPVRVLAVKWDFFPIEGVRRTVARSKRFWDLSGNPGGLDHCEDDSRHAYTDALARCATEFFCRHLLGKQPGDLARPAEPLEPSRLQCTVSGQIRGEMRDAEFTHEACLAELATITNGKKDPGAGLEWLRERVMNARDICEINPRFSIGVERAQDLVVDRAWWWSQRGIINAGMVLRPIDSASQRLPVTIALWDDGCQGIDRHANWIYEQCTQGRAVFVVEPTGFGSIELRPLNAWAPHEFYGVYHKLNEDLVWLGDSIAALRVWDILRSLDVIPLWPGLDTHGLRAYAHGRYGLYLELAAALDSRIEDLDIQASIGSYASLVSTRLYDASDVKTLIIPGILSHFDLPDLVELRASKKAARKSGTQG